MRHLMRVLFAARSAEYRNFSFTFPVAAAVGSLFLGAIHYANAGIINVPGDFPTIPAAIDAALNGDDNVGATDRLALLANWGACP